MIPLTSETREFWQSLHTWKVKFPYFALASSQQPVSSMIKLTPAGPFGRGHRIAAPPPYLLNAWCFESPAARDLFVSTYRAEKLEVK